MHVPRSLNIWNKGLKWPFIMANLRFSTFLNKVPMEKALYF